MQKAKLTRVFESISARLTASYSSIGVALLLLFVGFLVLYPLGTIIYTSLQSGTPGYPGVFTLDGYIEVFTTKGNITAILTSLWLGAVRVAIVITIATLLAWIVARTDTPLKRLLQFLVELRFFIPNLPIIVAWILLFAPRTGVANVLLMQLFNLESPLFNIFSYGGIIFTSVCAGFPIYFMLILPAFTNMDSSLEDSSRMCGGGTFTTFFRVTLPIITPALLTTIILAFIHSLESFEVEAILGRPAGIFVFSTRIYSLVNYSFPAQYTPAMALCVIFIALIGIIILLQWMFLSKRFHKYTTITGKGYAVRPVKLGSWKWVVFSAVMLFLFIGTFLPMVFFVLGTFMKASGIYIGDWLTLDHWRWALTNDKIWLYVRNSVLLGVGSATVGTMLYTLISYVLIKTKSKTRPLLEFLSWLPFLIPGVVLALGFLWVYVGGLPLPFTLYGTIWLLIICSMTSRMPFGVRSINGVMVQISKELEEASRVHGGSWWRTLTHIVVPLLRTGIINTWLIGFVFAVKELVIVLMLFTAKSKTLAVECFELAVEGGGAEKALIIGLFELLIILVFWFLLRIIARLLDRPFENKRVQVSR